ncbi:tyrosine-type recombinase/integrase [Escherichia coli]|nr:tyrosine-type recombinase/integrase [Escherichia coli]
MRLNQGRIDAIKRGAEPNKAKFADGDGLFLYRNPKTAVCSWRFRYYYGGKQIEVTFGQAKDITLATAREMCRNARALVAQGIDYRSYRKVEQRRKAESTFRAMMEGWISDHPRWTTAYEKQVRLNLRDVLAEIGDYTAEQLSYGVLFDVVKRIGNGKRNDQKGRPVTAMKAAAHITAILARAAERDIIQKNPATTLVRNIRKSLDHQEHSFKHLQGRDEINLFWRDLDALATTPAVLATKVLLLTGVRTKNVRHMRWEHIDLDAAVWVIPGSDMKNGEEHTVPLSPAVVDILDSIHPDDASGYVFTSNGNQPLHVGAVMDVIRRTSYEGRLTAHGFRHCLSTALNDHGTDSDVVELILAHKRHGIAGRYNHSKREDAKREALRWWADYVTKTEAKVIQLRPAR